MTQRQICGRRWAAGRGRRLVCQRKSGHTGAHVDDVETERSLRRYWFVSVTGERGVNRYRRAAAAADGERPVNPL